MRNFDATDDPRRRLLVQALAGGLIGSTWVRDALAADPLGSRPEKLPPGKSVFRIDGQVLVNGRAVAADTKIAANDVIETASGGGLVFVVNDNAMLVRGDSKLALKAPSTNAPVAGFELLKGRVLSVFGAGDGRRITTATASIAIKGTGFYIEADAEQTYFCTCYGATEVTSLKDPQSRDTVVSTHHDKPLYIVADGGSGRNIRSAPFINHTDQELMLIETLVGRTPPFTFPGTQYQAPRPTGTYRR